MELLLVQKFLPLLSKLLIRPLVHVVHCLSKKIYGKNPALLLNTTYSAIRHVEVA